MSPHTCVNRPSPPHLQVGDLEGLSCAPWLTDCVVEALRDRQYSVKVNQPYKGGYITKRHGAPKHGRHAVQVRRCQCGHWAAG